MTTDIEPLVTSWPGIEAAPHRLSGREFTLDGRELGHVHGRQQVDIPLPKRVRDIVVASGLASKHHLFPESGWVTKYLESDADVDEAVRLLRIAYLYQVAALQRRETVDEAIAEVDVATELDGTTLPDGLREVFPPLSSLSQTPTNE
ncbi:MULTISPECIES: luciferase domain-containing protein [Natrialbaceae]|uniref:luciferase domain-containing protein n=1 Tax=Natrialbaceae TaxID=1644061 RepID=UPI00207D6939|nr:luciferase family protein [Natronococcus sp. CG52]